MSGQVSGSRSEEQDSSRWTKLVVPDTRLGVGSAFLDFITGSNERPKKGPSLVEKTRIADIAEEVKNDPAAVGIVPYIPLNDDLSTKWNMGRCGGDVVEM